jgi:hypothetical protein
VRWDLNNFILCTGINQAALTRVGDDIPVIHDPKGARKALKKTSRKVKKKACQPPAPSIKRESEETNRPRRPFKKTSKKAKKKLVSALEI